MTPEKDAYLVEKFPKTAAEAAVGLAIVLAIYRNRDTIDMEQFNLLKW